LANSRSFTFPRFCALLVNLAYSSLLYADPDLEITGLDSAQEGNVRAYLSLSKETCESPVWKISRLFKQAPVQIQQALRALGYYHPQITKSLSWEDDCWTS